MPYDSIDAVQNRLSDSYFCRTDDAKKASGRALGTFVELITYYILKQWGFQKSLAIETRLPEYGVSHLTHNVEFTLHKVSFNLENLKYDPCRPLTSSIIIKNNELSELPDFKAATSKTLVSSTSPKIIKNGMVIGNTSKEIILAYADTHSHSYQINQLNKFPFAMFECKRVGKEGNSRGPQTIEKAKQGAYVAKSISSLQKIVMPDGSLGGIYFDEAQIPHIDHYNDLVDKFIRKELSPIPNFVLTVGVISNHGNWFTNDNMNKELEILSRSYDWLLFLQDKGLTEFVNDFLEMPECRSAFEFSYSLNIDSGKKNPNIFTKSQISYEADRELSTYFSKNEQRIMAWFNIITPASKDILELKSNLESLAR